MKKLIIFLFSVVLISCNSSTEKSKEEPVIEINPIDSLNISSLGDFENITLVDSDTLTEAIRTKLHIEDIDELSGYSNRYLYKGKTIIENSKGSIISLYVYSEGEASEHLISYDASGKYISNVVVGYDDWVGGYSKTSSKIINGKINIETINFDYSEEVEKVDTVIELYKINPDLTFTKNE